MKKTPIILATECYEGLGFAKLAAEQGDEIIIATKMAEGEKAEDYGEYDLNGDGIAKKIPLAEAVKKYGNDKYDWVFDTNHNPDVGEALRKKGARVLGGDKLSNKMEHDRAFGVEIATKYGLPPPPTQKCKSIADGLKHLQTNPDKAYVFKPDEDGGDKSLTFVPASLDPEDANQEVTFYLESLDKDPGGFILQERIDGVETNFEAWFVDGKPVFAFCGLENKKKIAADPVNSRDPGDNTGCAQDIVFQVPLECRGVKETIGKLFPYYRALRHTGFVDVNAIVCDRNAYFIEVCNRFGFSSHPNLFMNLAMDSFANIIREILGGKIRDMSQRFRFGFGASVSLYIEHPRKGLPITIPEKTWDHYYPYQIVKEDDVLFLSGYGNDVGVVMNHGYDIQSAARGAIKLINGIAYPGMSYRADLHKDDYPSSVSKRYNQIKEMSYIP